MTGPVVGLDALVAPERRGYAQALSEIAARLARAPVVELYGAHGALGAAIAAGLAAGGGDAGPLLYVVADDDTAETRAHDLGFFLPHPHATDDPLAPPPVLQLPAPESSPYAELQPDRRTTLARMAALFRLSHGFAPTVLVASAAALFRRVVPRAQFDALCEVITTKATVNRDALAARLLRAGFSRSAVVEDAGTFAVRGAVVDLFPPVYRHPIRIELYGDEIESIRLYDAATQRTLRTLDAVHIHPVRETVTTAGADPRAKILAAADAAVFPSTKTRRLLEQIEEGESFFGIDALAPAFHERMAPFFDYLPAGALCVVEEPDAVIEEARREATKLREAAATRLTEHRLALPAAEFVLLEDEAAAALAARRRLELRSVEIARFHPGPDAAPRVHVASEPHTTLRAELQRARAEAGPGRDVDVPESFAGPLRDRLRSWIGRKQRVRIVASSRHHADRLVGLLRALGFAADVARDGGAAIFDAGGGSRRGGRALLVRAHRGRFGTRPRVPKKMTCRWPCWSARCAAASRSRPITWWSSPRRRSSGPARCARRAPARPPRSATWARSPRGTRSSTTSTASGATAGSRS